MGHKLLYCCCFTFYLDLFLCLWLTAMFNYNSPPFPVARTSKMVGMRLCMYNKYFDVYVLSISIVCKDIID